MFSTWIDNRRWDGAGWLAVCLSRCRNEEEGRERTDGGLKWIGLFIFNVAKWSEVNSGSRLVY